MVVINVMFKLGINFENWCLLNYVYLYVFGVIGKDCWVVGFQYFWCCGLDFGLSEDFGQYCLECVVVEVEKFVYLLGNGFNYVFYIDVM